MSNLVDYQVKLKSWRELTLRCDYINEFGLVFDDVILCPSEYKRLALANITAIEFLGIICIKVGNTQFYDKQYKLFCGYDLLDYTKIKGE